MSKELKARSSLVFSLYLSVAVLCTWFWTNNPVLNNYNFQLSALLIVAYFIVRMFLKNNKNSIEQGLIFDAVIITTLILLITKNTGGLNSSFFFLIYFLLFAIALLFETITTLVLSLCLVLFFANSLNSFNSALQLLSLLFFTCLAIYFGKVYLKLLQAGQKIKILSKEKKQISSENVIQSNIITCEETNVLLWLTLNFKDQILKITHQSSELLSDIGRLTIIQKEKLQSIHETAKDLLKSGGKLKEKIDKETDE